MQKIKFNTIIIGGGIVGVMASKTLAEKKISNFILDKGYGLGGRVATRKVVLEDGKAAIFDYGAQYITVRDNRVIDLFSDLEKNKVVRNWDPNSSIGNEKFIGVNGLRDIINYHSKNLNFKNKYLVTSINYGDQWEVKNEEGENYFSDNLILTPPVPQILELFENSKIVLDDKISESLKEIKYNPTIAVLAVIDRPCNLDDPGYKMLDREPFYWLADNKHKGISPQTNAITVHCTKIYRRVNFEKDEKYIAKELIPEIEDLLNCNVTFHQIHKWCYSQPATTFGKTYLQLNEPGPMMLGGDAFSINGRIESAVISGLAMGNRLIEIINR